MPPAIGLYDFTSFGSSLSFSFVAKVIDISWVFIKISRNPHPSQDPYWLSLPRVSFFVNLQLRATTTGGKMMPWKLFHGLLSFHDHDDNMWSWMHVRACKGSLRTSLLFLWSWKVRRRSLIHPQSGGIEPVLFLTGEADLLWNREYRISMRFIRANPRSPNNVSSKELLNGLLYALKSLSMSNDWTFPYSNCIRAWVNWYSSLLRRYHGEEATR